MGTATALTALLLFALAAEAERPMTPSESRAFKSRYVALTDSWIQGIEYTQDELDSMQRGKQWERAMTVGPDDPLAKRIFAAGEPSFKALAASYPGKVLDRTVLGSYSDPAQPDNGYNDEFAIYWNGAIAAHLIKGSLTDRQGATGTQPLAHNTVVEFRVGADRELLGRVRKNYSSIGYEDGYLPIVTATYTKDGIRYRELAFAHKPGAETTGWDIAYVDF